MAIKSLQTLVSEVMRQIKTISADEAYEMFQNENCNLIDIREINELEMKEALILQFGPSALRIRNECSVETGENHMLKYDTIWVLGPRESWIGIVFAFWSF